MLNNKDVDLLNILEQIEIQFAPLSDKEAEILMGLLLVPEIEKVYIK